MSTENAMEELQTILLSMHRGPRMVVVMLFCDLEPPNYCFHMPVTMQRTVSPSVVSVNVVPQQAIHIALETCCEAKNQ